MIIASLRARDATPRRPQPRDIKAAGVPGRGEGSPLANPPVDQSRSSDGEPLAQQRHHMVPMGIRQR
jgi:hypothetical protein